MKYRFKLASIILLVFFSACSNKVVEIKPGSEKVLLVNKQDIANCVSKGKVTSTVTSKVGIYTRDVDTVEANLVQLAKNSAVAEGADTIVKGASKNYGEREFDLFKCR